MSTMETAAGRVARRLREARIKARMTVREVADCLDISHTLIVKYENNTVAPSFDRLDALARIYGLTSAALLAEQDAAVPLLATIDQANPAQLAELAHMLHQPEK
jgi:transcriptional regulator with XRE-family HTH domain